MLLLIRTLSILVFFGLSLSLSAQDDSENESRSPEERRDAFYDWMARTNSEPVFAEFLRRQRMEMVRIGIDRVVVDLLSENRTARSLLPVVEEQLQAIIEEEDRFQELDDRTHLISDGSDGEPESYKDLALMWKDSLRILGFSEENIENAKAFVNHSNTLNAFTYSGLRSQPRMVLFKGLVTHFQQFGEAGNAALKAVMLHEAGHIDKTDIKTRLSVMMLFFAIGEDIIPDRPEDVLPGMRLSDLAEIRSMKAELIQSLSHRADDHATHYTRGQMNRMIEIFDEGVRKIRSRLSNEQLQSIARSLVENLDAHAERNQVEGLHIGVGDFDRAVQVIQHFRNQRNQATSSAELNENAASFDIKAYMKLLTKLQGVLSNAAEAGADREVLNDPNISVEEAAFADLLLARPDLKPVDGEDPRETLRRELEKEVKMHARAAERALQSARTAQLRHDIGATSSHPNLRSRMVGYEAAIEDVRFRRVRNWFEMGLALWKDLSMKITEQTQTMTAAHSPLVSITGTLVQVEAMKRNADELAQLLIEEVISDLTDEEKSSEGRVKSFHLLVKELTTSIGAAREILDSARASQEQQTWARSWLQRLGSSGLIISSLTEKIQKEPNLSEELKKELIQRLRAPIADFVDESLGSLAALVEKCGEKRPASGAK